MDKKKLENMLELQEQLNCSINSNWRDSKNNWNLAIAVETVEAINCINWEWWKKKDSDLSALRSELVDVWHFVLSGILQDVRGGITLADVSRAVEEEYDTIVDHPGFKLEETLQHLQYLLGDATDGGYASTECLLSIRAAGMSFDELYLRYVGKNVLNKFRQDNGYKEGTYQRKWRGQDDNVYLEDHVYNMLARKDKQPELSLAQLQDKFYTYFICGYRPNSLLPNETNV